jgi:hypothetical protein
VPAAHRIGNEGRIILWTWDDRGRSAVTRESVLRDLTALRLDGQMLAALFAGLVSF